MTTFVLRSSDNALVWLRNPPVKPEHYPCVNWTPDNCPIVLNGFKSCDCHRYQSALTQAIAEGVKVADEVSIKHAILNKILDGLPLDTTMEELEKQLIPDTPYRLDVEVKMREEMRPAGSSLPWIPRDGRPKSDDGSMEYRQIAYLKPKQEEVVFTSRHNDKTKKVTIPKQDFAQAMEKERDFEFSRLRGFEIKVMLNPDPTAKPILLLGKADYNKFKETQTRK